MKPPLRLLACAVALTAPARAHDTWLEATPSVARPGDAVHVSLFLGNHGNDHRDFTVAGRLASLEGVQVDVIAPGGRRTDLVPALVETGTAPRAGCWAGRYVAAEKGVHGVAHLRDGIRHGSRGLKGGKTYFLIGERPDDPTASAGDHATPLGHPLELVLETHPFAGCGPAAPITVRLLHHGRPLANHRVSFIPRGSVLAAGFDADHERMTDDDGRCRYTPREAAVILVVAHVKAPDEKGPGYDATSYAATLVLTVPPRRPGRPE